MIHGRNPVDAHGVRPKASPPPAPARAQGTQPPSPPNKSPQTTPNKASSSAQPSSGNPGAPTQAQAQLPASGKLGKTAAPTPTFTSTKSDRPKEASAGGSKASARREAHTDHPVVMPAGRERGSGGGFGGSGRDGGHPDMHEWMPFSAKQSLSAGQSSSMRATVQRHLPLPLGLGAFQNLGLRAAVFSMFGRFKMEVLPSLFQRTPQELDQQKREIKKDALRKEIRREGARREETRVASAEPRRVLAGDLTAAFANS